MIGLTLIRKIAIALMVIVALTTVMGFDAIANEWFDSLKMLGIPNGCF